MSDLSDRILFSIMAGSAVAGFVGYALTLVVGGVPRWFTRFVLPGLVVAFLLAALVIIWFELELLE